ncbi:MAG: hypothetical protein MI742_11490 [Desulfobacterales bacterium]|nr:hypothetical protein [Desulfobacterales bacterium]
MTNINRQYEWTLEAYEQQGNLWIRWTTNAPFRPKQGQIHVYNNEVFPDNPQDQTKKWTWDNLNNTPWDTGLAWGSGWHCAYIAEKYEDQGGSNWSYRYLEQVVT